MKTNKRRLDKLEQASAPPGRIIVVGAGCWDWTPAQLAEAVRQAEQDAGRDNSVLAFEYIRDWRCPQEIAE